MDNYSERILLNRFWSRSDVFSVACSFNHRDYNHGYSDLPNRERRPKEKVYDVPGTLQLVFMFYSRLYKVLKDIEELVILRGEAGADSSVKFADPIDLETPSLTLRELHEFCIDFELCPKFVSRLQVEQAYQTVHPEPELAKKNEIGLSCAQFTDFLLLLAIEIYKPKRLADPVMSAEQRVKTLASYLKLHRWTALKSHLYDSFRDHHLQKYDELSDFDLVARRKDLLSRAKKLHPRLEKEFELVAATTEGAGLRKFLRRFLWLNTEREWLPISGTAGVAAGVRNGGSRCRSGPSSAEEQSKVPPTTAFLDMGVLEVGHEVSFRVKLRNLAGHNMGFRIANDKGLPDFVQVLFFCRIYL